MSPIKSLMMLASVAIVATTASHAAAKSVVAYILFDIAGSDAAEKLRSTSLGNCKQVLVGRNLDELIVHLRCDEHERESNVSYLSQAVMELAQVEGVRRATVLVVRTEGQ
jgi:hypothetical protein